MKPKKSNQGVNKNRRAGILLHPTSLPGRFDNGDIGHEAYRFIEFLNQQGYKVWQMLPLGPTHDDKSPYQCLSSHAGNASLISLDWLIDCGWLNIESLNIPEKNNAFRKECLLQAGRAFYKKLDTYWTTELEKFKHTHDYWLEDYALFVALKQRNSNLPWYEWTVNERHREKATIEEATKELKNIIEQVIFEQFVFFRQWHEIRNYAKKYGIEMFGDMPIFVARDSADVWADKENFLIDKDGDMEYIAGVPPDAFSDTGQRWGNPLYNWNYMQSNQFSWWKNRFKTQLELFDMIRIDHFRGLQASWYIPQTDETAINGKWVKVPGKEMIKALYAEFDHLPLVAEDLGVITEEVVALKNNFNLPGMKVLQFAFDGNNQNPHLPHAHEINDVVYSGTHDNQTTLGWIKDTSVYNQTFLSEYSNFYTESEKQAALNLIRMTLASVSFLSILPMQDVLMLDAESRMNTPGTIGGNWQWRFEWSQVKPDVNQTITKYMTLYQR